MTPLLHDFVLPWLNALALALIPVFGALALALLRKHGIDTTWFEAIGRAGGAAYANLMASGKPVTDKAALEAAAMAGAGYLTDRVPGLVASKGLSPDALAQVAGAELGKVLGLDPTTGPGLSTVTAIAGAGQTVTAIVQPDVPAAEPPKVDGVPLVRSLAAVLLLVMSLSACTPVQVQTTLADVRLFCATQGAVVALSTAAGTPILAQGQTKAYVDTACALAGGIAVSPPGLAVATVTIPAVQVHL